MPFFMDMLDGVDAFLNMFEYCLNILMIITFRDYSDRDYICDELIMV
jgi:hypothetical protein